MYISINGIIYSSKKYLDLKRFYEQWLNLGSMNDDLDLQELSLWNNRIQQHLGHLWGCIFIGPKHIT